MDLLMKENGRIIKLMDLEQKFGLIKLLIVATIMKDINKERVNLNGLNKVNKKNLMLVSLRIIKWMEKVNTFGKMVDHMKEIGKWEKCMEKVYSNGKVYK